MHYGYKAAIAHVCPCCRETFMIPYKLHKNWQYQSRKKGCRIYYCSYGCSIKVQEELETVAAGGPTQQKEEKE